MAMRTNLGHRGDHPPLARPRHPFSPHPQVHRHGKLEKDPTLQIPQHHPRHVVSIRRLLRARVLFHIISALHHLHHGQTARYARNRRPLEDGLLALVNAGWFQFRHLISLLVHPRLLQHRNAHHLNRNVVLPSIPTANPLTLNAVPHLVDPPLMLSVGLLLTAHGEHRANIRDDLQRPA